MTIASQTGRYKGAHKGGAFLQVLAWNCYVFLSFLFQDRYFFLVFLPLLFANQSNPRQKAVTCSFATISRSLSLCLTVSLYSRLVLRPHPSDSAMWGLEKNLGIIQPVQTEPPAYTNLQRGEDRITPYSTYQSYSIFTQNITFFFF